jgi:hypothetical protein
MDVLIYNELEIKRNKEQFDRVYKMLKDGNFKQAEVKKLSPGNYFRAKLNDADRLLFAFYSYHGKTVILLLEIIYNHEYSKSRFLNGSVIDESKLPAINTIEEVDEKSVSPWIYQNNKKTTFQLLDRPLSFDEIQEKIYNERLPLIMVGSAGSGKTVLSLEKLKTLSGNILYVTRSSYLADNAQRLYYSYGYSNSNQEVEFLSFEEFLNSIKAIPKEFATFYDFEKWFRSSNNKVSFDSHQLYEEFFGVLTGFNVQKPYLSREDYCNLGIKQSIFSPAERNMVYDYFTSFLSYLDKNNLAFETLVCYEYLSLVQAQYDYLVVDEVQDLTNVQLYLLLKSISSPFNFLLCGDSNQIVHPNFFSWSAVKSLFFTEKIANESTEIKILHANYRNSTTITNLANKLLKLKVARFGSVDKESNFLVDCVSTIKGDVRLLNDDASTRKELNDNTSRSVHFAVLVLRESEKKIAQNIFKTPLVFSIREAKGLEYKNIILFNIVSNCKETFNEITNEITSEDLLGDLKYNRVKDKSDRSLEIYKFFINALYVGMTRAVENLYWIEKDNTPKLFNLLKLSQDKNKLKIKMTASSQEEWKKEAIKLEAQGKTEQAAKILTDVLKITPVPWEVLTRDDLKNLLNDAFDKKNFNRSAKQKLLNYAHGYELNLIHSRLNLWGFSFASKLAEVNKQYHQNFVLPYTLNQRKKLLSTIEKHGIDFRNQLNKTSLMTVCSLFDLNSIKTFLDMDANVQLTDNCGLTAFHYFLKNDKVLASELEFEVYKRLAPSSITVMIEDKQYKYASNTFEYFALNFMLARCQTIIKNPSSDEFSISMFVDYLANFPNYILPEYRKKRTYISSILASKEIFSQKNKGKNNSLFIRVVRGLYRLNPHVQFNYNGKWLYYEDLLQLDLTSELNNFKNGLDRYVYNHLFRAVEPKLKSQDAIMVEVGLSIEGLLLCALMQSPENMSSRPYAFSIVDKIITSYPDGVMKDYVKKAINEIFKVLDKYPFTLETKAELEKITGKKFRTADTTSTFSKEEYLIAFNKVFE